MKLAWAAALAALLLGGCRSDLSLQATRLGQGHYRLLADRCHVIGPDHLKQDLRCLAARKCPQGAGALEAVIPVASRKGSLFGECLRGGALRAEVHCAP